MASRRHHLYVWERLADPSRRTILGFAIKLAFVLPLIAFQQNPVAAVQTTTLLYALWCAAFALFLRQRARAPNLNYWDEALWFFAASDASIIWREHGQSALHTGG